MELVDQHERNTGYAAQTVVADHKYGTSENYVACQERGISTHMGDAFAKSQRGRERTIFSDETFVYDEKRDTYRCPAGQILRPGKVHPIRRTRQYRASPRSCAACVLRAQCTRSSFGRTVHRHEKQALLNRARQQAHSAAARRDRARRHYLMEGSFADATNNHHFKRARWRRLWRQQIQDRLIAAIQNVRILLAHQNPKRSAAAALSAPEKLIPSCLSRMHCCLGTLHTNLIRLLPVALIAPA